LIGCTPSLLEAAEYSIVDWCFETWGIVNAIEVAKGETDMV
jgi:hypothetical protein